MKLKNYENVESSYIDFKEKVEYNKPRSWLKSVSAFANTKGGIILFGISDNLIPIGLKDVKTDLEKVTELINAKIVPLPRYTLKAFQEKGMNFMDLSVSKGNNTPYYYENDGKKEAFIRSGSQSINAPKHILDNLIIGGNNTSFDELVSKYKYADVSFTLLNATIKRETGSGLDMEKDLKSLGLVNDEGYVTNAGLLLSDQNYIKCSKIVCTRWKGIIKGNINEDAIDDKEYTGSIISQVENAINFVKNYTKKSWTIIEYKRVEKVEYPIQSIREAIINSVIHRDYLISGSEVHIDIFDDRLEITSPGGMYDGSLVQNLNISSIPSLRRNKIISDIFDRLGFMERRGSGITKIMSSYAGYTEKPEFISNTLMFKVIFPNIYNSENANNKVEVSNEDYFILKLYKINPLFSQNDIYNYILRLFRIFTFDISFTYDDIKNTLQISDELVNIIIEELINKNLVLSINNEYKFIK